MQKLEQNLDSREVAGMIKKDHGKLLKDIRRYIEYLTEAKIGFSDFFKKSEYMDSTGRVLPCYLITKKGCEFIANKLTGAKGTEFTARYINRFHEMEDFLSGQAPAVTPVQPDQLQVLTQEQEKINKELNKIKSDLHRLSRNKSVPALGVTYNGLYSYKASILSMLANINEMNDEIFLRQMYTLFKRHTEKCMR